MNNLGIYLEFLEKKLDNVYVYILVLLGSILNCLLSMYVTEFCATIPCPLPSCFPK